MSAENKKPREWKNVSVIVHDDWEHRFTPQDQITLVREVMPVPEDLEKWIEENSLKVIIIGNNERQFTARSYFKDGARSMLPMLEGRDRRIEELENRVRDLESQNYDNKNSLRQAKKMADRYANRCKPRDLDSYSWSKSSERKKIRKAFFLGLKCEHTFNLIENNSLTSQLKVAVDALEQYDTAYDGHTYDAKEISHFAKNALVEIEKLKSGSIV